MYGIILRLHNECRWRLRIDGNIWICNKVFVRQSEISRVHDYLEVGLATLLVGIVDRWIHPLLIVRTERRRQMSSCGEAQHSDPRWIDMPLRSMGSNDTHCTLCILQRCVGLRIRPRVRYTILQ